MFNRNKRTILQVVNYMYENKYFTLQTQCKPLSTSVLEKQLLGQYPWPWMGLYLP